jgi:hypothetical protein
METGKAQETSKASETISKESLGTKWLWTKATRGNSTVWVVDTGRVSYRITEERRGTGPTSKTYYRIDKSSFSWWEALDSKEYRKPTSAARAIIKIHKESERASTVERLTKELSTFK